MKYKIYIYLILISFCLIYMVSAGTVIKLGVVTKPGSAQNIVAEKFSELLKEKSGSAFTVKIYHSQSLGNETEILQQVQMGTIQLAVVTAGPFDTFDPIVRTINYPFLFKDEKEADRILDGEYGAVILESLETSGFKGLCFSENGFRNLTNNKKPVVSPTDIRGLKIRVMASKLHNTIWKTLGANPTPMPWPIYTELEQGVIDGQENPLWVMEVFKLYEIQKYMTLTRHVYSPHISVASLGWWNKMDSVSQRLIQESIYQAALFQRGENRKKNADRLEFLKDSGMVIEENPDIDAFRKKVISLKDMEIYKEDRVKHLLQRILDKVNSEPKS